MSFTQRSPLGSLLYGRPVILFSHRQTLASIMTARTPRCKESQAAAVYPPMPRIACRLLVSSGGRPLRAATSLAISMSSGPRHRSPRREKNFPTSDSVAPATELAVGNRSLKSTNTSAICDALVRWRKNSATRASQGSCSWRQTNSRKFARPQRSILRLVRRII